jgi:rRNA biogenesis protein RRP5
MKILCRVAEVRPYSLILSLPGQLLGHVPITQISSQLSEALERVDDEEDKTISGDEEGKNLDLSDLFVSGQFVRAVVTEVRPSGTSEGSRISAHLKDSIDKASRRVEMSLMPDQVNAGVSKSDLKKGFVSP